MLKLLFNVRLRDLNGLRMKIAGTILRGPGPEGAVDHLGMLDGWIARAEELEAALARQAPTIDLEVKLRTADARSVALRLTEGAVLVEFVRVNVVNFKAQL